VPGAMVLDHLVGVEHIGAIKIEIKNALPEITDEELKNLFEIIKNQNEY
jgi:hypothetical protein